MRMFATAAAKRYFVEDAVELRESHDLKVRELAKAQKLAEEHRKLIINKWHESIDRHRA
jgi:hypothetical protein